MTKAEAWDELIKLIRESYTDTRGDAMRKLLRIETKAHSLELRLEYDPEEDDRK